MNIIMKQKLLGGTNMSKIIEQQDLISIAELISKVLHVNEYKSVERLGGLTNHTYHVTLNDGKEYVIRIPGEGTQEIIVRSDEKISTQLAGNLGIDAEMLYFGEDGAKVTAYIPNAVTMSSDTLGEEQNIEQVAEIFRTLHSCGENTGVPFEVFDMAANYEKIIFNMNVAMFADYQENKQRVMEIKQEVDRILTISKVPCHNDALCENWVKGDGRMYLIDWEYAGMNDGMWDLADVSIEASFNAEQDRLLLMKYLHREPSKLDWKHFFANKIYVDYLWTLWAKARVPYDGQAMEDWAQERYLRMKNNIMVFTNI